MGTTRDKKPPVNRYNTEYIEDFSSGLNTTISGSLLNKNEAQVAEDVSFEQKGTIVPRKGRKQRYAVTFSDAPCSGLGMLYKQDGTSRLIVAADTELYYDEPRDDIKYTTRGDWEKGTIGEMVDVDITEGSLKMKYGRNKAFSGEDDPVTFGTLNYQYGIKFKALQKGMAFAFDIYGMVDGEAYIVSIWDVVANTKLIEKSHLLLATEPDMWTRVDFYDTPVLLEKDKEYVVSVVCPAANALKKYTPAPLVVDPMIEFVTVVTKDNVADLPDTVSSDAYIGLNLYVEQLAWERSYVLESELNLGTYHNASLVGGLLTLVKEGEDVSVQDDLSTGVLTNVETVDGKLKLKGDTWADIGSTHWNTL